jgi:hypothetical protein
MSPDYWLGQDSISSETDGILLLNLKMEDLNEAKQPAPDHGGYHKH